MSDKKIGVSSSSNSSLIDHYEPDIVSAQDYYPFGMLQPGRSYLSPNGEKYRYGFNGKENDSEVKGEGNQQDYGMRVSDPRLGRFLSVDSITKDYPELTPYQFASNRPIDGIDRDGLEFEPYWSTTVPQKDAELRAKLSPEEYNRLDRRAMIAVGTPIIALDLATGGNFTRTAGSIMTGYVFFNNTVEYTNRNSNQHDPKIRAENEKKARESASDLIIGFGIGKFAGKVVELGKGFKPFLNVEYSYGETTVSTPVGGRMVEIGKGGIGGGNYVDLEINVKVGPNGEKVASGQDVFEEIYKSTIANANAPINGIKGSWYPGDLGDNLNRFNKLILEKVNKGLMTVEQAALETFTGKMARSKGFTSVKSISGEQNSDGTYKIVNGVLFGK